MTDLPLIIALLCTGAFIGGLTVFALLSDSRIRITEPNETGVDAL